MSVWKSSEPLFTYDNRISSSPISADYDDVSALVRSESNFQQHLFSEVIWTRCQDFACGVRISSQPSYSQHPFASETPDSQLSSENSTLPPRHRHVNRIFSAVLRNSGDLYGGLLNDSLLDSDPSLSPERVVSPPFGCMTESLEDHDLITEAVTTDPSS